MAQNGRTHYSRLYLSYCHIYEFSRITTKISSIFFFFMFFYNDISWFEIEKIAEKIAKKQLISYVDQSFYKDQSVWSVWNFECRSIYRVRTNNIQLKINVFITETANSLVYIESGKVMLNDWKWHYNAILKCYRW